MGLRVFVKGVNRNKLVVHTMFLPPNPNNGPNEQEFRVIDPFHVCLEF